VDQRFVIHAGAAREREAEQTGAKVRILVLGADIAGELVAGKESVDLCHRVIGIGLSMFLAQKSADELGKRGKPEVCVARSTSVICLPPRCGILTSGGRYLATGSSSETSPRCTMIARIVEVKTLVQDPISKMVSSLTGRGSATLKCP